MTIKNLQITGNSEGNTITIVGSCITENIICNDVLVNFKGKNNYLVLENGLSLKNTKITFSGDDSVVYISKSNEILSLSILIYNESLLFIDKNMNNNNTVELICSEAKNIIIGHDCLFSHGVNIRTGDAHVIYDIETKNRINLGKSVFIGDHVWIAANATILKGCVIHSGSVIGANTVISNKKIKSNCVYAGNPGKMISDHILYSPRGTHTLCSKSENTLKICPEEDYNNYIFSPDDSTLSIEDIDNLLISNNSPIFKLFFASYLSSNNNKNRFYGIACVNKDYKNISVDQFILENIDGAPQNTELYKYTTSLVIENNEKLDSIIKQIFTQSNDPSDTLFQIIKRNQKYQNKICETIISYINNENSLTLGSLARKFRDDKKYDNNLDVAIYFMRLAVTHNVYYSRDELFDLLYTKNTPESCAEAIEIIMPQALKSVGTSMGRVARAYRDGKGVKKDLYKSAEWARSAMNKNVIWAPDLLYDVLIMINTDESKKEALEVITEGVRRGIGTSAYKLACAYIDGTIVQHNENEAKRLLEIAIKNNVPNSKEKYNSLIKNI